MQAREDAWRKVIGWPMTIYYAAKKNERPTSRRISKSTCIQLQKRKAQRQPRGKRTVYVFLTYLRVHHKPKTTISALAKRQLSRINDGLLRDIQKYIYQVWYTFSGGAPLARRRLIRLASLAWLPSPSRLAIRCLLVADLPTNGS